MTQTRNHPKVPGRTGDAFRENDRWVRLIRGPLAVAALAVLLEALSQGGLAIPRVDAFLILIVVYVAFVDGVAAGVATAALAVMYYAYASSPQARLFHLPVFAWEEVVIVGTAMPVLAVIVGVLRYQLEAANTRERTIRRELDTILEQMQAGFYTVHLGGVIGFVNRRAAELIGADREALSGRIAWQLDPGLPGAADDALLTDAIRLQQPQNYEWEDSTRDEWFDVQIHPFPGGAAVHFLEITERKRMAERAHGAAMWEALGRLAGGVAHDFNNLLTAIRGYTEFVMNDLDPDDHRRASLEQVTGAANRAARLTRQLLAYAKRQVLQPQALDLNLQVADMEDMLRRLIRDDVILVTDSDPRLFPARVDAGQLEQIILNLVINASDAMPDGGRLTIRTSPLVLDRPRPHRKFVVEPGAYAILTVEDTGVGMDEATMERIFEPFFTTKDRTNGTGLGLSTVYGIVKQSGGYILVESEPGKGSAFHVWLPRSENGVVLEEAGTSSSEPASASTILVVEDDDSVRALSAAILRGQGHHVIEARDGLDALAAAERCTDGIDLLFTDIVMPRLSGRELARRLTASHWEMKVLFTSGYTNEDVIQDGIARGVLDPNTAFLHKPFSPTELVERVRVVLGERVPC